MATIHILSAHGNNRLAAIQNLTLSIKGVFANVLSSVLLSILNLIGQINSTQFVYTENSII